MAFGPRSLPIKVTKSEMKGYLFLTKDNEIRIIASAMPTPFLIDQNGIIIEKFVGFQSDRNID